MGKVYNKTRIEKVAIYCINTYETKGCTEYEATIVDKVPQMYLVCVIRWGHVSLFYIR